MKYKREKKKNKHGWNRGWQLEGNRVFSELPGGCYYQDYYCNANTRIINDNKGSGNCPTFALPIFFLNAWIAFEKLFLLGKKKILPKVTSTGLGK